MKKLVFILLLAVGVLAVRAEIAADKRREIEKMLRLSGMEKMMDQMMDQMIASFKTTITDVPPEFWEKFKKNMNSRELIDKFIPLYDKYFTTDDLKAVNAFYETPAGQKILTTMPKVMSEAMTIGQQWGEQAGRRAAAEAEAERKK